MQQHTGPEVLIEDDPGDRARLEQLLALPHLLRNDTVAVQRQALAASVPAPGDDVLSESPRWVHFPWRHTLVRVLGPRGFRRLRLDRNRNKITVAEQDLLGTLRVGVVGLSVGHAIAHTIALEGSAGVLRLADFDEIELSNLNRIPASIADLGVNKAVAAARRIAEIDPYLTVEVMPVGLGPETADDFLDGLDVVLEECDSFDAKLIVRDAARRRGIPVIMETSDGGVLDVERFDLEPERPLVHGMLGDIDATTLTGLTTEQKMPYALRLLDPAAVTSRMAASALEVGRSLTTWPQLGGDVALGGGSCAAAIRRLGTGRPLPSGRTRVDLDTVLDDLPDPLAAPPEDAGAPSEHDDPVDVFATLADRDAVLYAAARAPSPDNLQPWRLQVSDHGLSVVVDDDVVVSRADIDRRASATALGAVVHNMRVAASARSVLGEFGLSGTGADLTGRLVFGHDTDETGRDVQAMLRRSSSRLSGDASELTAAEHQAIVGESTDAVGIHVVTGAERLAHAAELFGMSDRVRYLTPHLHSEMLGSVRWPGDDDQSTGLSVDSLGMPPGAAGMLDLLRRAEVMAHLADWDSGSGLGEMTRAQIASSSALAVVTVNDWGREHFATGGMVAEALWVRLTALDLSACPVQPLSFYARGDDERSSISPEFADELCDIDSRLRTALDVGADTAVPLVIRVFRNPRRAPVSRRRPIHG